MERLIKEEKLALADEPNAAGVYPIRVAWDRLTAAERLWVEHRDNRLLRDIYRHDNPERRSTSSLFRAKKGVLVGVERNLNTPMEDYRQAGWSGRLTYRRMGASPTLAVLYSGALATRAEKDGRPPRVMLELKPSQRHLSGADFTVEDWRRLAPGVVSGLALNHESVQVAQIYPFGENHVIEVLRVREAKVRVTLNGSVIHDGDSLPLRDRDVLTIASDNGSANFLYSSENLGTLISDTRVLNSYDHRVTLDSTLPFAETMALAIDRTVKRGTLGRVAFSVELSIDRQLQAETERRLSQLASSLTYDEKNDLPRASCTVMDGTTGELLALATWADGKKLPAAVGGEDRLRNHNLERHPIGSAAKTFTAAAALETHPELAALEVPYTPGGVEWLFQVDLDTPYREHPFPAPDMLPRRGGQAWVDFPSFLQQSSNRFEVELGTLALANWIGAQPAQSGIALNRGNAYRLGGLLVHRGPDLSAILDDAGELRMLNKTAFFDNLGRITNVRTHYADGYSRSQDTEAAFKYKVIKPLLEELKVGDLATASVMNTEYIPDRVNLSVNQWRSVRGDLVGSLLGGASSQWTNVQAAEAISRIVANAPVEATLVRSLTRVGSDGRESTAAAAQTPSGTVLTPRTWDVMRKALALPTTPGGTAARLAPALASWNAALAGKARVKAYSKTGTLHQDIPYARLLGLPLTGELVEPLGQAAIPAVLRRAFAEKGLALSNQAFVKGAQRTDWRQRTIVDGDRWYQLVRNTAGKELTVFSEVLVDVATYMVVFEIARHGAPPRYLTVVSYFEPKNWDSPLAVEFTGKLIPVLQDWVNREWIDVTR